MGAIRNIQTVVAFGWPYMRRYWLRLLAGILLGIAFGVFNASFVWGTKTLFERLDPESTTQISQPRVPDLLNGHSNGIAIAKEKLDSMVNQRQVSR